jgi:hypothetical protein
MKEQILRTLATRNSVTCRNKIKQLRVELKAHILQNKRAKIHETILSCTSAGTTYHATCPGTYYNCYIYINKL